MADKQSAARTPTARRQRPSTARRVFNALKPSFLEGNALGDNLLNLPLFNRLRRGELSSTEDFGMVSLMDQDYYIGLIYAVIRNRANHVSQLATEDVVTRLRTDQEADVEVMHPYLDIIDDSPTFSNYYFYVALSTFLDLKGVAYVMAVRNFQLPGTTDEVMGDNPAAADGGVTKYGEVQEFKIVNPYTTTKILKGDGTVGGYVETQGGMYRTIPPEQMIEVKTLNPFNLRQGWALAEAAKESTYNLRQASTYTRHAIKNNVAQRGLLTTEVILEDEEFDEFVAQVDAQSGAGHAGRFLVGNGPGSIAYQDMQVDLDKLALDAITNINREDLFAVGGVSKTMLGMEQSGVTRETANVQRDLFTGNHGIPQLQAILDALNQDYRNCYADEYASQPLDMYIESPLRVDKDAELKDAQIVQTKANAAQWLVTSGYDPTMVLEVVGLEDMGHTGKIYSGSADQAGSQASDATQSRNVAANSLRSQLTKHYRSPVKPRLVAVISGQQASLKNGVRNIQGQIFDTALTQLNKQPLAKLSKNKLTPRQATKVLGKDQHNGFVQQLQSVLTDFYLATVPLFAAQTVRDRLVQYARSTDFTVNDAVKSTINTNAARAAASHVDTVTAGIYNAAYDAARQNPGLTRAELTNLLTEQFNGMADNQAEVIARTESNRAVADGQYEADKQFLEQNDLTEQAYKVWVSHSGDPCEFCAELEGDEVPFGDPFVAEGDSVDTTVTNADGQQVDKSYVADYGDVEDGDLHPNCECTYELVIEGA